MYESFFDCRWRPFASTPDARSYVPVGDHPLVLQQLKATLLDGQGIAILTAPAGLGKSLLIRRTLYELRESFETVCLASANFPTRRSLLQAILYELGHSYSSMTEQELRLELMKAIETTCGHYQGMALAVDEAHRLRPRLLEELRTIADQLYEGRSCVRLLLCGQLELEDQLALPELEALRQRVRCHSILQPLTLQESHEYLLARLQHAGADPAETLTSEARMVICRASDGNPRCLNQLADHSLLLAYMSEERPVSEETVRSALDDLRQLPLQWNEVPPLTVQLTDGFTETEQSQCEQPEPQATADQSVVESSELSAQSDAAADKPASYVVEFGADDEAITAADPAGTHKSDAALEQPETGEVTEPGSEWEHKILREITGQEVPLRETTPEDATDEDATGVVEFGFGLEVAGAAIESPAVESSGNYATVADLLQAEHVNPADAVQHDANANERGTRTMDEPNEDVFVEVPVLDRYALLDSGRELPAGWPRSETGAPNQESKSPSLTGGSQPMPESDDSPAGEVNSAEVQSSAVEIPEQKLADDPPPAGAQSNDRLDDGGLTDGRLAFSDDQLDVPSRERAERSLEIIDRLGPMLDAALDGELPELSPEAWATQLGGDKRQQDTADPNSSVEQDSSPGAADEREIHDQLAAMAAELGEALGDHAHPGREIVESFRKQVEEEVRREQGQLPQPVLDPVSPDEQPQPSVRQNPRPVPTSNGLFSRLRKQSDRSS